MGDVLSRGKVVARRAELLTHPLLQLLGLMFSRQRNLVFELNKPKKVRMHMFFVFYPIDVVLLNPQKEVIELKNNFKPFRIFFAKNKAKYVLELKRDTIEQAGIRLGDKLSF